MTYARLLGNCIFRYDRASGSVIRTLPLLHLICLLLHSTTCVEATSKTLFSAKEHLEVRVVTAYWSPLRVQNAQQLCNQLRTDVRSCDIFRAFNGQKDILDVNLNVSEFVATDSPIRKRAGKLGAAVSKLKVLADLLQNSTDLHAKFLVLEDDTTLVDNFIPKLEKRVRKIDSTWSKWDMFTLTDDKDFFKKYGACSTFWTDPARLWQCAGFSRDNGNLWSYRGASKVMRHLLPLRRVDAFDRWIRSLIRRGKLTVFLANPYLVSGAFVSEIGQVDESYRQSLHSSPPIKTSGS